jgi:hypothetical protein
MKHFIYARKSASNEERRVLRIEAQLAELKKFAALPSVMLRTGKRA